jgi:glycosyltransferase involved in cell wall biosynthesis
MDPSTNRKQRANVAVLLATYNGNQHVGDQIRSLKDNNTPFTLHWLDDYSADDTRNTVRTITQKLGIPLKEWHQPQHLGVPSGFFRLLECVAAEIYLFCDQDDIWQPGKIDATVSALMPLADSPALCFSEPLVFSEDHPNNLRSLSELHPSINNLKHESRMFMPICMPGHTHGFTRPLREIFLRHKEIAYAYAFMHDWWLYNVAVASGTVRLLSNVPTTLYRIHAKSVSERLFYVGGNWIVRTWRSHQFLRKVMARQARGFLLASSTMPPGTKLEHLCDLARLIGTIDRRQSLFTLSRLARQHAIWRSWTTATWFITACLFTDAAAHG